MEIPSGAEHLDGVIRRAWVVQRQSCQHVESLPVESELLGTSLSALYQAATCHRRCFGGPHIFEALCGRIYNLAVSAYLLAMSGFYDEALNLTRSIGEIANLISLSIVDKKAFSEWLNSDTKTRITKFGPAKVRQALKEHDPALTIASDDWYADFCEKYTHVTPETRPNLHAVSGQANVGGAHEPGELGRVLAEVATIVASVAMHVCRYARLDDLFFDIVATIESMSTLRNKQGKPSPGEARD